MRHPSVCIISFFWLSVHLLSAQAPSNIYHILSREQEALQCRWELIHQASSEILLSTYAIQNDEIGLATLQLLVKAAERGVSVKLLLDDFDNGLPNCLLTYLEERGVHTKVFNIMNPFKLRTIVDRMHGKMLLTDRRTLLVGGRNLADRYFLMDASGNFLDREVYVVSDSAVQQARQHFEVLWNNPNLSGKRHSDLTGEQRLCWKEALEKAPGMVQKRLQLPPTGQKGWDAGFKNTNQPVHFIHDNFSYDQRRKGRKWRTRKDRQATYQLIELTARATSSLDFENPYFIPTKRWRRALKASRDQGVRIRLLTNSSYTNDVPMIQAVYLNRRARALKLGIEIWEYRGPKMLHTKAIVIDKQISAIGSYNLEKLSHMFNSEVMVWVDDPALAAEHNRLMEDALKSSVQVGKKHQNSQKLYSKPSKIQRKRHCKVQFFRFTLAPLLGIFL